MDLLLDLEVTAKSSNNIKPADADTLTPSKPKGLSRFPSTDSLATDNLLATLRDEAANEEEEEGEEEDDGVDEVGDRGMSTCFHSLLLSITVSHDLFLHLIIPVVTTSRLGRVMKAAYANTLTDGTFRSRTVAREQFAQVGDLLDLNYVDLFVETKKCYPGPSTSTGAGINRFPIAGISDETGMKTLYQGWVPTRETSVGNLTDPVRKANVVNALLQYLEWPEGNLLKPNQIKDFSSFPFGRTIPLPRVSKTNFGESKYFATEIGYIIQAVDHFPSRRVFVRHLQINPSRSSDGYVSNTFHGTDPSSGKLTQKNVRVHQLIAFAFLGHDSTPSRWCPLNGKQVTCSVDHKNHTRHDNRKDNLRWATPQEQNLNKKKQGLLGYKKARFY